MLTLPISNNKLFMKYLLKDTLFDNFEVREVTMHTFYRLHMDGKRNIDFYDTDQREGLSEYITWVELRGHIFELIKGTQSPTYFKIILSTPFEKTQSISPEVSTFFLNITYKDGVIQCTTGTAYSNFSLDQTPEKIWDNEIKEFLISQQLV